MRNVTLSLVSVSLYPAFGCKVLDGSKIAFTKKNTNPVHEQIYLSLTFYFFVPILIVMTCLSPSWVPQPLLQAISLQNYFPERTINLLG